MVNIWPPSSSAYLCWNDDCKRAKIVTALGGDASGLEHRPKQYIQDVGPSLNSSL